MRLSDCFVDLFAYVSHVMAGKEDWPPSGDILCRKVSDLIAQSESFRDENGFDRDDYDQARFAVFVWIDEMVMKSAFDGKSIWQKQLLQRRYYKTSGGGVAFYTRLEALEPEKNQVREVYYLCLSLGFSGRYGAGDEDRVLKDNLKARHLKRLTGTNDAISVLLREKMFPDAYAAGKGLPSGKQKNNLKSLLVPILLGAAPVGVFVFLYTLYRFILNNEIITKLVH